MKINKTKLTMSTETNDDFSMLMKGEMYQSTEERIFELEKALLRLIRRVEALKEENVLLTQKVITLQELNNNLMGIKENND